MSEIEENRTAGADATGNSYEKLVSKLREDLEKLEPQPSQECRIYRVPRNLRRVNEGAFTPQSVSIGPLHRADENLKKMEKHKLRYLERFLKRTEGRATLQDFVGYVKDKEVSIRHCYAETFDELNSDEFARMILIDAAYIIEFILRCFLGSIPVDRSQKHMFETPFQGAALCAKDFVLLENQLPFFVLEGLWEKVYKDVLFSRISHNFFNDFNYKGKPMKEDIMHFTDLVRYYQLPEEEETDHTHDCWVLDCLPELCQKDRKGKSNYLYSVSELHEAGVRFRVSRSRGLHDLNFHKGVLEMPFLTIFNEGSVLNIMALEQCHYPDKTYICDYFILMDYLIDTPKDVELLVQKKILVNHLDSDQEFASLVNKLGLEILSSGGMSRYSEIIKRLNAYRQVRLHKWMANLRRDYFKTPWRGASTIAAITVLFLTLAQIISSFPAHHN